MLIGLPGSGKTTYVKDKCQGFVHISTDELIEKWAKAEGKTYSEAFYDFIDDASVAINDEARKAFSQNANVVWDQTNLSAKSRRKKLLLVPPHYDKVAVIFKVDYTELERRLIARAAETGKDVPKMIFEAMKKSFEKDQGTNFYAEGFNWVEYAY
jgi:predicted kinase